MDITTLFVSQRKLRRIQLVPELVRAIRRGDDIPPISLTESDDGTIQVHDGHHRIVAYRLSGRILLEPWEYTLVPTPRPRARFGRVADLIQRTKANALDLETSSVTDD